MRRDFLSLLRLEWSFTISTVLLVVVLIGTTMCVVHSRLQATLHRELELRGRSIARSIGAVATPSLLGYNYAALQLAAEGASGDVDVVYVAIHDKEGAIAGVAGRARAPLVSPLPLPAGAAGPASFDVDTRGAGGEVSRALEVVVPVHVDGSADSWGAVRVGLSRAQADADLRRIDIGLVILGAGLALLAAAIARWLSRWITAPLRQLARATDALAAGDMSHRIRVSGAKELADLARAFNVMMDRVQEKARESDEFHRQLEALNANLEESVRARTRALVESEAQYKTLVEHSPDAILIVQEGRVRFVSHAFFEIFGIPEEIATSSAFDLCAIFEPSSSDHVRERLSMWERGETSGSSEVFARDASGRVRNLEVRGSRIEYRGAPAVECLLIDATETTELRERLGVTEKLRSLGELAGGVAHDFNNLLGAILGRVQLLRDRGLPREIDGDLSVIEKAALDGRETVRRIQEFSRVRKDRRFKSLDVAEILRDAMEITRSRWKADPQGRPAGITVSLDAPACVRILGNAAELREVFTNLILNAVDAMPKGGSLTIACAAHGDDKVRVEVKDTGLGMSETVRRHLFDPFFSTKGLGGMGLGLSVVYGIVTRHGGAIEVLTELGSGTTFVLDFPQAPEDTGAEEASVARVPAPPRHARILVIDDEPEIAAVLRDVLTLQGHDVTITDSGRGGVAKATAESFDLVLTDLGIPDLSGFEVAEQIHAVRPSTPVVLVTGWAASLDEDEIRRRGVAALLHKPFEIEEVVRTTNELLAQAHAGAAAAGA